MPRRPAAQLPHALCRGSGHLPGGLRTLTATDDRAGVGSATDVLRHGYPPLAARWSEGRPPAIGRGVASCHTRTSLTRCERRVRGASVSRACLPSRGRRRRGVGAGGSGRRVASARRCACPRGRPRGSPRGASAEAALRDRHRGLDALREVPGHPVGRADQELALERDRRSRRRSGRSGSARGTGRRPSGRGGSRSGRGRPGRGSRGRGR